MQERSAPSTELISGGPGEVVGLVGESGCGKSTLVGSSLASCLRTRVMFCLTVVRWQTKQDLGRFRAWRTDDFPEPCIRSGPTTKDR